MNEAIKEATICDEELKAGKPKRGPLHGIPISLKDTIDVRGIDSTVGIIKKSFQPASKDSTVVEVSLLSIIILHHLFVLFLKLFFLPSFLFFFNNVRS